MANTFKISIPGRDTTGEVMWSWVLRSCPKFYAKMSEHFLWFDGLKFVHHRENVLLIEHESGATKRFNQVELIPFINSFGLWFGVVEEDGKTFGKIYKGFPKFNPVIETTEKRNTEEGSIYNWELCQGEVYERVIELIEEIL